MDIPTPPPEKISPIDVQKMVSITQYLKGERHETITEDIEALKTAGFIHESVVTPEAPILKNI